MAYDDTLADRLRDALAGEAEVTEKKMFGGFGLMVGGNICVGVIGDDMIVRFDKADADEVFARPEARPFDFTGRPMKGWAYVDAGALQEDSALMQWVRRGLTFAKSLPAK